MTVLVDLTSVGKTPPRDVPSTEYPASMRTAPWQFSWVPGYASGSLPVTYPSFICWTADDKASLFLFYNGGPAGNVEVQICDSTAAVVCSVTGCTFSAGSNITFKIDPVGMTLTLAGFTAGNGTYAISGTLNGFWPSGNTFRIGGDFAGSYNTGGTYGDIINLNQTVSPTSISSSESVLNPTITPGAVTVSPSAIASAESVPSPTVTVGGGTQTISPSSIASEENVPSPSLVYSQTLSPSSIASDENVPTPTVINTQIISPSSIASAENVPSPAVAQWTPFPDYVYPVKMAGTSERFLVDQNNVPFLMVGDTAWSMIVQLTLAEAEQYLDDRQTKGFNAILVNLIDHQFGTNAPANIYNVNPFSGTAFQSTPTEAYFALADSMIAAAAARGIVVLLAPVYLGYGCGSEGWCAEVTAASSAQMYAWGQYVGNRYKDYTNIIWVMGGDTNPDAATAAKIEQVVAGIQSQDANHIFTAHNAPESQAIDSYPGATWLTLNNFYTYSTTLYVESKAAYDVSPTMPFFLVESAYENEHSSTPQSLRAQAYWSLLTGATGQLFGNCPIWHFGSSLAWCGTNDWQSWLSGAGSISMARLAHIFLARPWHLLVPDTGHTVMTAGYGTYGATTYATTACASDGSTLIAYVPTQRAVTIAMSALAGTSTVYWVEGATGGATVVGSYANTGTQSFTPPSTGDWVLVIDQTSKGYAQPGASLLVEAIASSESVPTPTVTSVATVSPAAIASAESVPSPTVTTGAVTISPSSIASAESVPDPTITASYTVSPTAIASEESVPSPTVTPGAVTISPSAIASDESVPSPTVTAIAPGTQMVSPSSIASEESVPSPTVTPGAVTISPSAITSAESVPTPTITSVATISPTAIASAESVPSPTVTPGVATISPTAIASAESVPSPTIYLASLQVISPTSIPSAENVPSPSLGADQGLGIALGVFLGDDLGTDLGG